MTSWVISNPPLARDLTSVHRISSFHWSFGIFGGSAVQVRLLAVNFRLAFRWLCKQLCFIDSQKCRRQLKPSCYNRAGIQHIVSTQYDIKVWNRSILSGVMGCHTMLRHLNEDRDALINSQLTPDECSVRRLRIRHRYPLAWVSYANGSVRQIR